MPTVQIRQGFLAGSTYSSIHTFLGIPYASPPLGPLRWAAPSPPPSWSNTRDVSHFGPSAIQTINTGLPPSVVVSEDCLYLNIWASDLSPVKQPVMVWIHGGGFLNGSSSMPLYNGECLARKQGVVVVSFNYRLGAFGFLRHEEMGCNFGLLDCVAALKWVSHNIQAFGGDPRNVTIFGQSSGAVLVRSLLCAPGAEGLFHRAIIQSAGFEPYVAAPNPSLERVTAASEAVFDLLGSRDVEVLRSKSAEEVRAASFKASGLNPPKGELHTPANLNWYPVCDGKTLMGDFCEWSRDIPVLFGVTAHEMRGFYRPNMVYGHLHLPVEQAYTASTLQRMALILAGDAAEAVLEEYKDATPHEALAQLGTAALWHEPALAMYHQLATQPGRTAYFYRFERVSPAAQRSGLLALHTGELPYVFRAMTRDARWQPWGTPPTEAGDQSIEQDHDFDVVDERVSEAMQEAWAEFARTGVPSTKGHAWPQCTVAEPKYTVIGDEIKWKSLHMNIVEKLLGEMRRR